MRKILTFAALLSVSLAIFAACGGDDKTVKIPGGGEVSTSDKIPDGFPGDFPVYDGAKVTGSYKGKQGSEEGFFVSWETGDSVDDVKDFYNGKFEDGDWKSTSTFESNGSSIIGADNAGDKKSAVVTIGDADGKTTIAVFVGDNPDAGSSASSSGNGDETVAAASDDGGEDTPTSSSSGSEKSPTPSPLPDEVKLPKDFPTDRVPLPSGARVTSASSFGSGGSQTYIIEFYTKDDPEKVSDYFSTEMPKHGWSDSFSSTTNGEYFVTFTSGDVNAGSTDGMTVNASASEDTPGYTQVGVTVSVIAAE